MLNLFEIFYNMKKYSIIIIGLIFIGYGIYSYIYQSHRDIASEKGIYRVTVQTIFQEFQQNETKANAKYLDKTIEVTGKVTSIDKENKSIVMDDQLYALCSDSIPIALRELSNVKIKGRFIGYDDLLGELKMDQCTIIEK